MWLIMGLWFCAWGENDPHPVIAQSCQINVSRLASAGTETNDPFEKNPEASQVLPFQRNLALLPSEFIQPHILPLHFFIFYFNIPSWIRQGTLFKAWSRSEYSCACFTCCQISFYFCLSTSSNPISPPAPPHPL